MTRAARVPSPSVDLAAFNASPPDAAAATLLSWCASRRFASLLAAGRPYPSADAVEAAISSAFDALGWEDVAEALAGHPRIGARVTGQSAAEQSGVTDASRAALAAANADYEARFGHVFLICAAGLSGEEMLAALRDRLANTPFAERTMVTRELRQITVLRARKALRP
ncbi:MAG: 2-oxo-4-hydroxy-4-carboxy-5-ureidoimidazoline decarboxylase [Trebonia sp.]